MKMCDDYHVVEIKDWTRIPKSKLKYDEMIFCYHNSSSCTSKNLGLYLNERDEYCASGFVGICVLKDKYDEDYISPDGKKIILKVVPRFKVSPWIMLSEVMNDREYEKYASCAEKRGEQFYEIFDDEKPILMDVEDSGGEVLLAITCIRLSYKICTGILSRKMDYVQENLNGKIRGRVDFSNHIKKNVVIGREDRIYCKYPKFTEDTIENQILKNALILSEKILRVNNCLNVDGMSKIREMLVYCRKRLSGISEVVIRKNDFLKVNTKGFNSSYEPVLKIAQMLILNSNMSISIKGDKSGYVVPYAIRMETIFEFYARATIKKYINEDKNNKDKVKLDEYRDVTRPEDPLHTMQNENMYLMNRYIPDIAIMEYDENDEKWKYTAVLDVKYQKSSDPNSETVRHNSHQLLFYALLLNVKRCGFIFPEENDKTYKPSTELLILQDGDALKTERIYTEFHLGYNTNNRKKEMSRMLEYAKKLGSVSK